MQSNYQRWKIWFEARKCNEQKLVVRYKLFNNDDNLRKLGPPNMKTPSSSYLNGNIVKHRVLYE